MKTLIFSMLISILSVYSQNQFQRTIGGTGNDVANSIIQTTDGGYVIAGSNPTIGAGGSDMYIVKIDGSGTMLWNKTIGGTMFDVAYSIIQTTSGGYIAAGTTTSFGAGGNDIYIINLDASGNLLWSKTIGGTLNEYAYSIIQTTDGGYALVAATTSYGAGNGDMYIIKLDNSGTLQWNKTIGWTNNEVPGKIIQTTDGGYVITGFNYNQGGGYLVKLDAIGTIQWTKVIPEDGASSIIQTTDGGYALAGDVYTFGAGGFDLCIQKLAPNGDLQWSKTLGGTIHEQGKSIIQTTDGGYVVAGMSYSLTFSNYDCYIVKFNGSGIVEWNRIFGGTGDDRANSIIKTTDGGYAIAGITNSFGAGSNDFYIVKLDAAGNTCGNSFNPSNISGSGGTIGNMTFNVTSPTPTIISPTSLISTGGTITAVCNITEILPVTIEIPNKFSLSQNYPNPFNPSTKIRFALPNTSFAKLVIYDALGREMETLVNEQLNAGIYEAIWSADKYSSGVYYYKITTGEFSQTNKMILLK